MKQDNRTYSAPIVQRMLMEQLSILEADKKDLQQKLLIARDCAKCLYCSNTKCKNNIGIRK
jgi:hypothetical protein